MGVDGGGDAEEVLRAIVGGKAAQGCFGGLLLRSAPTVCAAEVLAAMGGNVSVAAQTARLVSNASGGLVGRWCFQPIYRKPADNSYTPASPMRGRYLTVISTLTASDEYGTPYDDFFPAPTHRDTAHAAKPARAASGVFQRYRKQGLSFLRQRLDVARPQRQGAG